MHQVSGAAPPSGWYPDPLGRPVERLWTGSAWSEQTRALPPPDMSTTAAPMRPKDAPASRTRKTSTTRAVVIAAVGVLLITFTFKLVNHSVVQSQLEEDLQNQLNRCLSLAGEVTPLSDSMAAEAACHRAATGG